MLRKSITYTNPFTEQQVTEEHYFHISKADLVEMEMEEHGEKYTAKDGRKLTGMQAKLQRIIDAEDGKAIMAELKDMIRRSYGKKIDERFRKSDEIWQEFSSTEAFSQLLFELCTDASAAGEFMSGLVPSNLALESAEIAAQAQQASLDLEAMTNTPTNPENQGRPAGNATVIDAVEKLADATGADFPKEPTGVSPERQAEIDNATPANPVTITQAELASLNINRVKVGLGSGALQL